MTELETREPTADYLEFAPELLAETADGAREAEGLALPYGQVIDRFHAKTGARRQVWAPGSVEPRDNPKFYYGHDHLLGGMPIGRVIKTDETEAGSRWRVRFAKTAKAAEVHALMKPDEDGMAVIDKFSVGFWPKDGYLDQAGEYGGTETDPVYVHTKVDGFEVSAVPVPAIGNADIDSVLSARPANRGPQVPNQEESTMTETLDKPVAKEDFDALAEKFEGLTGSIDNLDRRIATLGELGQGNSGPVVPGRSYGEFLQMLAADDKDAIAFLEFISENPEHLAYTGGTISDVGAWVKDSWVGDIYRPITEQRRLHSLFKSSPLPASGMNVEYGKLLADTTDVGEQAAEGDTLDYGKLTFTTATAAIKTYGGWSDMSRQEVERSGVGVVQMLFEALVNRYAQVTEAALRTVVATVGNSHALAGAGTTDLTTPDGWTGFVIDAAFWLDDKGLQPEFILAGRDKFKQLALMRQDGADGDYFLDRTSGSINVAGLGGQIFNLPVIPVNSNGLVRVGHSSAIRTFEDGAAPFRLQDDDITNLTKAFSIYGYEAIAVQDKDALVSPDVTA